jgi:hypothetical protein
MPLSRKLSHGASRRGGLLIAAGWLSFAAAHAAETVTGELETTNSPALTVDVHRNVEGTFTPYRIAFVTAGTDKFTFLMPEGYRLDTSNPSRVRLASPDFSGLISIGLASEFPLGVRMDADTLRTQVMTNYSDATIRATTTVCANGQTAPAIDFLWKADSGLTRLTRTTFIPTTGGLMEFTLTASPEKFEASLHELNLIMLTFRSGVNGKFDFVIGSNHP